MTTSAQELVQTLIDSGHLTLADIRVLNAPQVAIQERTHVEHLPRALAECLPSSLRTYRTTFRVLVREFGDVPLTAVTHRQLSELAREVFDKSVSKGGIGVGAQTGFIHGARFFYRVAVKDGLLLENPAMSLILPKKRRRVRRALTTDELTQIHDAVLATSRDLELDLMLLDFHRETAARQAGAIALRIMDININRPSVLLREKGGHEREVPISAMLAHRLLDHSRSRGGVTPEDSVFRYRKETPVTRRRYNTLFGRVQDVLPWAKRLGVSSHWYRHTTLSDIAAVAGVRVASAYAGHADRSVIDVYTVPTFEDLKAAHNAVFFPS